MYTCQTVIVALGLSNPFRWREDRRLEYFNECCVLSCCYVYFLFTDFVPDPLMRKEIGNYMLMFTGLNVVVNLILIIHRVVTGLIHQKKVNRRKR